MGIPGESLRPPEDLQKASPCENPILLYNINMSMNPKLIFLLEKIEASLIQAIPYNCDPKWLKASFGDLPQAITDNPKLVKNLMDPNLDLMLLGGKRWRPLFLMLCFQM